MDMDPEQGHPCGNVLRLSGRSGTSDHQGSLFPQEKIQMKFTMWKESKCSKRLSLLPSDLRQCYMGSRIAGGLVYFVFGNCCFWWGGAKVRQWDWYHSTTASCTSLNYKKIYTIEKELPWHKSVCVCSPKACFVPALALMQGCLLFVAVSILANHFYFGVEITP